jgi:hypothetical protein
MPAVVGSFVLSTEPVRLAGAFCLDFTHRMLLCLFFGPFGPHPPTETTT